MSRFQSLNSFHESGDTCQITATALAKVRITPKLSYDHMDIQSVSNFCSASVKLLRLGEIACQKIIHNCINKEKVQTVLNGALKIKRGAAGSFNPMLDLASARHELAFSRLFIS